MSDMTRRAANAGSSRDKPWITYKGSAGIGRGKNIVFISGDEEYRSEEALPMLARILAVRHGFDCTVLFAIDPESGMINPNIRGNIPGLHHLESADMLVLFTRYRELPDNQMKYIIDYTESGRPVMGLRTATHAFLYRAESDSRYAQYGARSTEFEGGYGRQILGETWVNHHGAHGKESTRGVLNEKCKDHPILRGVADIWGPTDVYSITTLTGNPEILVYGQVLTGMNPGDPPVTDGKNDPMMPVAWIKTGKSGKQSRVFCTTMGASVDLESEGLRRLLINGCYWCMGMENRIPEKSDVDYVGTFKPTFYGFGNYKKELKPSDFEL